MSYQISYKDHTFLVILEDAVTINEVNTANEYIQGNELFDDHRNQIWDFTGARLDSITEGDTLKPAATDLGASRINPDVRIAIIVSDEHARSLSQLYIGYSKAAGSPWRFKLFSRMDDALQWIRA